jgi:ParB family chromosome partitioning protein
MDRSFTARPRRRAMKTETEPKGPRQPHHGSERVAARMLKDITVTEIDRDPHNRTIDEIDERFLALVDSIRVFGVLQRIHVRVQSERFELIDGERRYRAAVAAGLEVVPCEIWPAKANRGDVVAAGIVLNEQRQAHCSIHVARRLRDLKNAEGLTSEEVAQRMAMPLDRVKTYFSLFGASDFLITFLGENAVPLKVAAEFVRYERATSEGRSRKLVERYLEAPLTREQIAELRKRATDRSEPEKSSYERGRERTPAVARAIERAYRRDAQTAVSAIEAALRPLGYLLVAVTADEPAEFPEK